eukprot:CAMPEP_0177599830 /NCGR_PEP_ID=MMETSP0419_2-20121207/13236_1 /TAXON_ID=582737 /ORGANISM="Tetraselmis sp., Strain GSL018" /LENGTH=468 /DNA_ID=CAMNT_0019092657 /DNA_START=293 /DNA_END=1701 /DNA_ORIENTATION=-
MASCQELFQTKLNCSLDAGHLSASDSRIEFEKALHTIDLSEKEDSGCAWSVDRSFGSPPPPETPDVGLPVKAEPAKPERKSCSNCGTLTTPLWRYDKVSGTTMCNACGVYFKNHGVQRTVPSTAGNPRSEHVQQKETHKRKRVAESAPAAEGHRAAPPQQTRRSQRPRKSRDVLGGLLSKTTGAADGEETNSSRASSPLPPALTPEAQRRQLVNSLVAAFALAASPMNEVQAGEVLVELRANALGCRPLNLGSKKPKHSKRAALARTDICCAHCGTSTTPLWRKDRATGVVMCNACGIYLKTHGRKRPLKGSEPAAEPNPEPRGPSDPPSPRGAPTGAGGASTATERSALPGEPVPSPLHPHPTTPVLERAAVALHPARGGASALLPEGRPSRLRSPETTRSHFHSSCTSMRRTVEAGGCDFAISCTNTGGEKTLKLAEELAKADGEGGYLDSRPLASGTASSSSKHV